MDQLLRKLEELNTVVNSIVWGPVMVMVMLLTGIYFTFRTHFFQMTHCGHWLRKTLWSLSKEKKTSTGGISSFQAMTTALAGAIGTGNIVGVATAITLGGPGSVFWMWVASFFGMMTIYGENILGMRYREKNSRGEYVGGPMYYIKKGLSMKWLAILFSIFCILSSFGMGNMAQVNSVALALHESFHIDPRYTGLILCLLVGTIIFGGVKRIGMVTEKIVPLMSVFYLGGCLLIIAVHAHALPQVFKLILEDAFAPNSICGGLMGFLSSNAMKYGIARGVFSNEAGLGSSPIIYAASNSEEVVEQGMWGIFQVFFDTIVGCTFTALSILCSGTYRSRGDGIVMTTEAFNKVFGHFGTVFVSISIALFAFATVIGWSYCGERSAEFIAGEWCVPIYKSVYAIVALFGCVMDMGFVWDLSDTFNGLMAIPNLAAILALSPQVFYETRKYLSKIQGEKKRGTNHAQKSRTSLSRKLHSSQ